MSSENVELRKSLKELEYVNSGLKEDLLDLTSRTMRDNLVSTNIPESYQTTDGRHFEDTEMVITDFFRRKLNLNNIGIERVHRIKPAGRQGAPRDRPAPIVCKFSNVKLFAKQNIYQKAHRLESTNSFPMKLSREGKGKRYTPIRDKLSVRDNGQYS